MKTQEEKKQKPSSDHRNSEREKSTYAFVKYGFVVVDVRDGDFDDADIVKRRFAIISGAHRDESLFFS
jgi:hypothetical protein